MASNGGLEGVVAATTALSFVDGERGELVIAGFPVGELAEHATFEETTWLLWHGDLPSPAQLEAFRGALAAARDIPDATSTLLRECADRRVGEMDALRIAAGTLSLVSDEPAGIVARVPTIVAAYGGCRREQEPVAPRRDLGHAANYPVHVERRRSGSRARPRTRDLPEHRDRSWSQRVDVHGTRHHVDRLRSRVGGRGRAGRAQGAASRRRAGSGARHGLRDRRRIPRRSRIATQDRGGREVDGLRPPHLQGARSESRRPRESGGADVHARRRHVALYVWLDRSRRKRSGSSRGTSRVEDCRQTWSSTRRCYSMAWDWMSPCSRQLSPSAESADGSHTRSSSGAPTASSGRNRNTWVRAIETGCPRRGGRIRWSSRSAVWRDADPFLHT